MEMNETVNRMAERLVRKFGHLASDVVEEIEIHMHFTVENHEFWKLVKAWVIIYLEEKDDGFNRY